MLASGLVARKGCSKRVNVNGEMRCVQSGKGWIIVGVPSSAESGAVRKSARDTYNLALSSNPENVQADGIRRQEQFQPILEEEINFSALPLIFNLVNGSSVQTTHQRLKGQAGVPRQWRHRPKQTESIDAVFSRHFIPVRSGSVVNLLIVQTTAFNE